MRMVLALTAIAALASFAGGLLIASLGQGASGEGSSCRGAREIASRPVHFDLNHEGGKPASFLRRFDYSALVVAAFPDQIRSIDHPCFDTPAQARSLLKPLDLVVGVEHGGEVHAYPLDLLALHEVVNDKVGGRPIAVTYCPLCSTALAFDRRVARRTLDFAVSGLLFHANLMLFDRETKSLWSQLLGGAVTGRMRGQPLRPVPLEEETWAAWRAHHPNTVVLSIRRDALAYRFIHPYEYLDARGVEMSYDPYESYRQKAGYYYPLVVRGVRDGSLVVGVARRGRAKAYPLAMVQRRGALEDTLAGEPVLVTADPETLWASVFSRRVDVRTLSFRLVHGRLVDRETATQWSPSLGRALSGPLAGAALRRLPSTSSYWFAWRSIHPATAIYRP